MLEIIQCSEAADEKLSIIAALAREIWQEHYAPSHGIPKVNYMLDKFQSKSAIMQQIKESYLYYLFRYNKKYIGYLGIKPYKNRLFLSKLYIKSEYRGKRLGKQALNFVENITKEKNIPYIELTVAKDNTDSIRAYEKAGFKIEESIIMDIGNGFVMDDYLMRKYVNKVF